MTILILLILLCSSQAALAGSSADVGASVSTVGIDAFKDLYPAAPVSNDNGNRSPELKSWMGRSRAGCRIIKMGRNPQRNNFAAPQISNVLESCQRDETCICNKLGEWPQGINYLTGAK